MTNSKAGVRSDGKNWMQIVQQYNQPETLKSWWQVINSAIPYFGLIGLPCWLVFLPQVFWYECLLFFMTVGMVLSLSPKN